MARYNKEMPDPYKFSSESGSIKPLVVQNIRKGYGDRVVIDNESVSINPGDKIGLVGRNGSGKSTLMRIVAGLESLDGGKVLNPGIRIGYLAQDYTLDGDKSVYEVATESVSDLVSAVNEFERMSENYDTDSQEFVEKYGQLLSFLQENNAFDISDRVTSVLSHLGVNRELEAKVSTLSGGQTVRLALARILISNPDVLLLDEPTNHLDLHANLWLREFLNEWNGALVVVSHDRDFLDEITSSTWELEDGKIREFGGNYSFYKEQKGLEEDARKREVVRLTGEVKKSKKKMEKEKERAAHSARRDLSKKPEDQDKVRAHYFKEKAGKTAGQKKRQSEGKKDEYSEQLEAVKKREPAKISPNITESETHKGKLLVSAKNITCSYEDKRIIEDASINIHFGDRISLFGNNGAGKSTFVKSLVGWNDVITEGELKIAPDINIQVLDQAYAIVSKEQSVLENIQRVAPVVSPNDLRQHLARFLFRETTDVNKSASVLSGGETARLALAMIAIQPIDLLILDEPTNNLDVSSIEEIESVLTEFKGAVLVVSHDISFLRNIGVSHSYVVSDKRVKPLMYSPSDEEQFKEELLMSL